MMAAGDEYSMATLAALLVLSGRSSGDLRDLAR
jgi:hypothetical protein